MAGPIRQGAQRALRLAAFAAAFLLTGSPAEAQTWREYRYSGFAIQFPAEPTIEDGTYSTAEGTTAAARIYSAKSDGALYKVTVADLSRSHQSEAQALGEASGELTAED